MERTMTEKKLAELLKYSEAETCDFKEEIYHVEENDSKVSFLKDVLAMANTIRYEPAYIVVGVRQKDGHNSFVDVDANIDENDFITFIKGNIGPEYPDFTYYTFKYNKHRIGIFEIGISKSGPYVSKKSYGEKVKSGQVYYRYGSVNSEADEEKVREITRWMNEERNDNYKLIAKELELENQDKYNYILLIGEEYQFSKQQYDMIANMKWSLIIDYSTNAESGGLQQAFHNERVAVHKITPEQSKLPPFYEDKTLFWYFAPNIKRNGSEGIDARAWSTKYFNSVNQCIGKVIASLEKRVIFVSLFTGECRYKSVDNLIDANANGPLFYKHIDFSREQDFSIFNEDPKYIEIHCLCDDVCEAFAHNKTVSVGESQYCLLQEEKLRVNDPSWIHEEMEPLYVNIENMDEFRMITESSFFQGREIQWNELNPCIAAERKKYRELIDQVNNSLGKNNSHSDLIKLEYEAGAGATTVMRMVAWYFHEEVPVVMLKAYSKDGTRERLRSLSADVNRRRILLMIDVQDMDLQWVNELIRNLEVDNVPVTILFSRRHMGGGVNNYLEEQLKGNEISAFETIYNRQVNALNISENEKEIRRIAISKIRNCDTKGIIPFIYALCTFEDSFIKLSDYVQAHIGNVNDTQKKILAIIASIHYYTGLEVPMVLLQRIVVEAGGKSLANVLTRKQYALLVICNEDVKTIHHSVSREVLKQICAYELNNKKAWRNKLKSVLMLVIKELTFFRSNDNVMRILKALFLNHQQSSNAGAGEQGHFSYAIDDLPTYVEKKEILEKLCDKFDANPYVYSNMARYYYYVEEDEDTALEYIQQAMDIMEDYTFYHLKGIALAKKMRNYIQQNSKKIKSDYSFFVRKLYDTLEEVEAAYDKSIELNVENLPAYTSKMNYLLATVRDVQKYICPEISIAQMMKSEKHAWCNDYIAKVNETLENIRIVDSYMNMNHNNEIEDYEAQVLSLEENLSEAISGWNNLLAKEAVYRPSIRRNLVNAYYRTCNKQWTTLNYEKGMHVRKLLIDNIQEEPEEAKNIIQWFDYARNFEGDLSKTIEYFQQYVSKPGLEYYYRAMLTFFAYGLENTDQSYIKRGMDLSNQCEELAREQPNRRRLLDVYNPEEKNLRKIKLFKNYLSKTGDFDSALKLVPKVRGRIVRIDKPEMGWINLEKINVNIKFNPSYNPARTYKQTKDEGEMVEFVLGFRAEGAFAFAVTECTETQR